MFTSSLLYFYDLLWFQSAPFGLVEVLMEASAVIASTLPLLGANRLPPHSDNDRHLLPADTPSTAADRSDGGGGAVNRLWAWQQRLCLGAAGAFAVLCGFAVTPVWPPPLLWACASSVDDDSHEACVLVFVLLSFPIASNFTLCYHVCNISYLFFWCYPPIF